PEREEILIRRLGFGGVALHRVRSTDLEMRECTDGQVQAKPRVGEDFLELSGGLAALMCSQIRFPPHIDGIQGSPTVNTGRRLSQLIRRGASEIINGGGRTSAAYRKLRSKGRHVIELHERVFWESLGQIVGERSRSSVIPDVRQSNRYAVLHIPARRARHCQAGNPSCFVCVAEQGFPQTCQGNV